MATESTTETATASLRRAFEAFDTDKSGSLSVEELKAILSRGKSPLTDADVQEIVDQFDENKDGVLQIDEFVNAWAKLCATNPMTALSSLFIYKPDTVELISSEGLSGRVLVADLTGLTVDNAAVPRLVELIKGAPSLEALLFHSESTIVTIDDVAAAQTLADVALEHDVSLGGSLRNHVETVALGRAHHRWFPGVLDHCKNSQVWAIFAASEVKLHLKAFPELGDWMYLELGSEHLDDEAAVVIANLVAEEPGIKSVRMGGGRLGAVGLQLFNAAFKRREEMGEPLWCAAMCWNPWVDLAEGMHSCFGDFGHLVGREGGVFDPDIACLAAAAEFKERGKNMPHQIVREPNFKYAGIEVGEVHELAEIPVPRDAAEAAGLHAYKAEWGGNWRPVDMHCHVGDEPPSFWWTLEDMFKKLKKTKFRGCKKLGDGVLEVGDRVKFYSGDPSWPNWGVVTGIGPYKTVGVGRGPTYKIRDDDDLVMNGELQTHWDDELIVLAEKIWVLK